MSGTSQPPQPMAPQPMEAGATLDDLTVLGKSPLLVGVNIKEVSALAHYLEQAAVVAGTVLEREHEQSEYLTIILEGSAEVTRKGVSLRTLHVGDYFGGLALAHVERGSVTVTAVSTMRLARLPKRRFDAMAQQHPMLALHLVQALLRVLGEEFNAMTDSVGVYLKERSLPRHATVAVRLGKEPSRSFATGISLRSVLPEEVTAVGALVNGRPVALDTPLVADAAIEPIALTSAAGREMYRRSVGVLLLEALAAVDPALRPSGAATVRGAILIRLPIQVDRVQLARDLAFAVRTLTLANKPFREEVWGIDEARTYFREQGWTSTLALLRTARSPAQTLATCGNVYSLGDGAMLASTGAVGALAFAPHADGILVDLGRVMLDVEDGELSLAQGLAVKREHQMPRFGGAMQTAHRAWLETMGVDSVGAFNEVCISGRASSLIRTGEGFHEKQIGRIADAISERAGRTRIICVAGPSSSGKTTFIRRLTVQLEVNGVRPIGLSLDDYYVDRDKTPRDAAGAYDFETLGAVNLPLFHEQLRRLLAGEELNTARYDFLSGRSLPSGGAKEKLGASDVVLVEGIHGLNPAVVEGVVSREQVFNIFVHPATTLSLDGLECVSPEQVRLLRRIVRDRHGRGYAASETLERWASVLRGDALYIYPYLERADFVFDTALAYELGVLKVYAERYLLEVPEKHPMYSSALKLRHLIDRFIAIYPDQVPPTSLLREFIGGNTADH